MTTRLEKGIAIGIVLSSAVVGTTRTTQPPYIAVDLEKKDMALGDLLQRVFGGEVKPYGADLIWRVEGKACKSVIDKVVEHSPACAFFEELVDWASEYKEYFKVSRKRTPKSEFGEWVNSEGKTI